MARKFNKRRYEFIRSLRITKDDEGEEKVRSNRDIAELIGCTRQNVGYYLKRYGDPAKEKGLV